MCTIGMCSGVSIGTWLLVTQHFGLRGRQLARFILQVCKGRKWPCVCHSCIQGFDSFKADKIERNVANLGLSYLCGSFLKEKIF